MLCNTILPIHIETLEKSLTAKRDVHLNIYFKNRHGNAEFVKLNRVEYECKLDRGYIHKFSQKL